MNDRIKLAKAMNLDANPEFGWAGIQPYWYFDDHNRPFDPFTDANDDYAVLEWSRTNLGVAEQVEMHCQMGHSADYTIGDYARAALKFIDEKGQDHGS